MFLKRLKYCAFRSLTKLLIRIGLLIGLFVALQTLSYKKGYCLRETYA